MAEKKDAAAKADAPEKKAGAAKSSTAKSSTKAPAKASSDAPKGSAAAGKKADAGTSAKASAPAAAGRAKDTAGRTSAKSGAAGSNRPEGAGGALKLHHLRPAPGAHTAKTRVGRGEGSKGKTAGRGTKGTKARYQVPSAFEGGQMPLHMRLPKLRGFKNPFRTTYQVVNLDKLGELYPQGGDVTPEDLVAKGAVRKGEPVKVLGDGNVSVKLDVAVQAVSASAREKILAAGGSVRD